MTDVHRVAQAKHSVSQAFQEGLPVSEVGGSLLQPLGEPLGVLRGLSVCVGGQQEHAHRLVGALNRDVIDNGKVGMNGGKCSIKHSIRRIGIGKADISFNKTAD